jgi:putative ABC transport system permease protein
MFKIYFKTGWRNIIKNKVHSSLNIVGLSVGMAVALLISLWILNELSFDKYHTNYHRIAQVMQSQLLNSEVKALKSVPIPLGEVLRTSYSTEFEKVVMSTAPDSHILTAGDNKLVKMGRYMQAEAPSLFSLRMVKGSANELKEPSSVMLSASTAQALFGKSDPINKLIKFDNDASLKVTGVYEDLPSNTTLHDLAFIVPWELQGDRLRRNLQNWGNNGWQIYVQLAKNVDIDKASAKIRDTKLKGGSKADERFKPVVFLHAMKKWHLYSEFKNGVSVGGQIQYVWLFGTIGVFVLLLACINFMNLSTARSEKRAKEVGVRKAIGSSRSQLIKQFFGESLVVAFLAYIFSLMIVIALLPFFSAIANEEITMPWSNPLFWIAGIGFSILVGLIAGSYPAFYLSSFQSIKVLKGTFKTGKLAVLPRKVLVVVQFAVSIVLIIGTIVVFRQVQFGKNRTVGYNREGLINIRMLTPDIYTHFDAFRNELIKTGVVEEVAESSTPVTESNNQQANFDWEGRDAAGNKQNFATVGISQEYGRTVGWQFLAGRDYRSGPKGADALAFVVNESAAKLMGFKDPIGKTVRWMDNNFQIIGMVKDMVMESPFDPVTPTIFYMAPWKINFLNIRMKPGVATAGALQKIEQVYARHNPGQPFEYKFADDEYARKFAMEERVGKLAIFFAALAMFISCLGIFGMASFMAEQRTKEIGVRKVLGASVLNLWGLLTRSFVMLVLISVLVAVPLAHYFMTNWLQGYEYRADLSWWIFAAAGAAALVITLLTVSFQAIKAAIANPVKSLRTE